MMSAMLNVARSQLVDRSEIVAPVLMRPSVILALLAAMSRG
jgi:hypothetical protein